MSTRNLPVADNLSAIYEPMSENVGASTSLKLKGLYDLYRKYFTYTASAGTTCSSEWFV
jgi:hypothetical protein